MEEEKEKSKLDKLKKGIGVGILAGALGLGNVSGTDDKPNFVDYKEENKIETSIQNPILANKEIELQFEDDVYYPDGKIPPREFFEKHINRMTVDDSLKPILVDILMRRSSEYELNRREIKKDINRLVNNVEEIIVDDNEGKDWSGENSHFEKTIRLGTSFKEVLKKLKKHKELNTDFYNSDDYELHYNSLYQILTHEVYHALNYESENGEYDLEGTDREENRPLHEVIVEKAADRTVMNTHGIKGHNLPFEFTGNTYGYKYSTFILDIIEATYGISEKEFLESSIKGGREKLIKTLAKSVNENPNETRKFINNLQEPFNIQFNTHYSENNNKSKQEKIEDIKVSMANIYMVSLKKMNNLIDNRKINNIKVAKEYVEHLKYNYYKLNYIMKKSFINERECWGESIDLDSNIIKERSEIENRIYNMNEIIENASELGLNEQIMELFNQAKNNQISFEKMNEINEKYQKKIHITDCKDWEHRSFDPLYEYRETEAKEKYSKDDWRGAKWNNKEINQKIEHSYEKMYDEHKKEGILRKFRRTARGIYEFGKSNASYNWKRVKNVFSNMHNRIIGKEEPLMLNSGEEKNYTNITEDERAEENHIKTAKDERKEFMESIKVDVSIENGLNSEKNDQNIDKTQEQQKSQNEGFERELYNEDDYDNIGPTRH